MKGAKYFMLTAAVALMLLALTGCGISDKIGEKIIEKAFNDEVDLDLDGDNGFTVKTSEGTIQTGNDLKWPKESMGDLPAIKATILSVVVSNDSGSTVYYEAMDNGDMKKYIQTLKEMGYDSTYEAETSNGGITFTGKKTDGATVIVLHSGDGSGGISYSVKSDE